MSPDHSEIKDLLTQDEFNQWQILGKKILGKSSDGDPRAGSLRLAFYSVFCEISPFVLKKGAYHNLCNWAEQGLEISERSLPTAIEFFRSTPIFLRTESIYRLRTWASGVMLILSREDNRGIAAAAFFKSSAQLLEFMTFRELREWTKTGLSLTRYSSDLALEYFSLVPDGLNRLYSTEWLRVCLIGAKLTGSHPEEVAPLYRNAPSLLLKISPALRDTLLDAVKAYAESDPASVNRIFGEMATTLQSLLYPIQEAVLKNQVAIAGISPRAARAYMNNVGPLLDKMHDAFLTQWTGTGIDILMEDREAGIQYFSLQSPASKLERLKWENAVLLDDFQQQLVVFTHALASKKVEVRSADELAEDGGSSKEGFPSGDGEKIYLPPYIVGEQNPRENFCQYKIAAAHQAGYIAYGTFDAGLAEIISHLGNLASSKLALDIFFILEDGRIDRCLGKEYAGLKGDIDRALSSAMEERPDLSTYPLAEALVEILLRHTIGYLVPRQVPDELTRHAQAIHEILTPSFENASSIWDTYAIARRIFDYIHKISDGAAYAPPLPIPFRGRLDPEFLPGSGPEPALPSDITQIEGKDMGIFPMPLAELKALIEKRGVPENLRILDQANPDAEGLYISDLDNIKAKGSREKPDTYDGEQEAARALQVSGGDSKKDGPFYYDEWDHLAGAYRNKWCRLHESAVEPIESDRVDDIRDLHRDLILRVQKQFQRIRPDILEIVRRVEWGDDIDLSAMVESVLERKAGTSPSDKIFSRREKKIRQVATLFLLDMSASTSELIPVDTEDGPEEKKIIDFEIEGLVVLMEALEALSDQYGIYGFSGYGRKQVDFYRIKDFSDVYSAELKKRICGIEPKQGTRMGPAIRHAIGKLKAIDTDQRILMLLSDGYPQDHDYGEDRRTIEYGLHDTMMALLEAKKEGIKPFCITVDQGGNDYLRKMCDPASYLVIKDISNLPEILPKVVESLMG